MGQNHSADPPPAGTQSESGTANTSTSQGAKKDVSSVLELDAVIARQGQIAVTSRYTSDRRIEDEFIIEQKTLGSGMSGPVQMATCKADNKKHAVKSFKKKGLPMAKRKELQNEVEIYLSLDHPHVARLDQVFETDEDLHLVMELMAGGELYDRLSKRKQYTEEAAADTTHQMLLAVAYLHANKMAHRDLKLENFLYESKEGNHLKLIDFGFAKFWDHSTKMSQACGSVHYVAPEVLHRSYTPKADLWSLGVIVYMLLTGSPPFHGPDNEVLQKIKSGNVQWSRRFEKLTAPAQNFVRSLLVVDPEKRLSAEQAIEDVWIKSKNETTETPIDLETLESLRDFAHASSFRRAVLSMMAWSLSTEERMELRQQFLSMDKENKGTISHTQMKEILEENFHVDSHEAEALFKGVGKNNVNEIAYSEFLAAALQGRVKVHEDLLRKTFSRFDRDENGSISTPELKQILGEHFEGHDIEELIKDADTDKDGTVDYDEFLAYFQRTDDAADDAPTEDGGEISRSRKHKHTEKMGALLDVLIVKAQSEEEIVETSPGMSPSGSPSSRRSKPLRKADKK